MKKYERSFMKNIEDKGADWILGFIIYSIFIGAISIWILIYFFNKNFGDIGDIIGGIFGPILTFGSTLFVYRTVMEQIKANKAIYEQNQMIAKQFEEDNLKQELDKYFEFINKYINDFKIKNARGNIINGFEGLNLFSEFIYLGTLDTSPPSHALYWDLLNKSKTTFFRIMNLCEDLFNKIDLLHDKGYKLSYSYGNGLKKMLSYQLRTGIFDIVTKNSVNDFNFDIFLSKECIKCGKIHGFEQGEINLLRKIYKNLN